MERYTEYHAGIAVIKDENKKEMAMMKLANYEFNRGEKGECDRGNFNTCDVSFGW